MEHYLTFGATDEGYNVESRFSRIALTKMLNLTSDPEIMVTPIANTSGNDLCFVGTTLSTSTPTTTNTPDEAITTSAAQSTTAEATSTPMSNSSIQVCSALLL